MALRVVGAGLPRTGTSSLRQALEHLLGGTCCHMSELPGHPFNLGAGWGGALAGKQTDWQRLMVEYVAAVDWPASAFWRELHAAYPHALVLLSSRDSAQTWWESLNATVLPVARETLAPGWNDGRDLIMLLERFTGTTQWDDPTVLMAAYERHNAAVRQAVPNLLDWQAKDGWEPICGALNVPVPAMPFPHKNRREDWG